MALGYLDGEFVDQDTITIRPSDYGFARGMTLFEFTRVYGGVPYRLEDHIQRFRRGAAAMGMRLPISPDEISKAAAHIASANRFPHSGIKFYLTMGECNKAGVYGFKTCEDFTPHLMMIEDEVHPQHPEAPRGVAFHERGVALKTVDFYRQIFEAKSINYAAGFIAARQLAGTDYDEILYRHQDGFVTETTTSNFFCVIDGKLCTPVHGMLGGVTRIVMIELAQKLGISVAERDLTLRDLQNASEAFISGSFLEMMPVRMVDNITYTMTTNAPVYSKLRKAFTTAIAAYCSTRRS